MHLHRPFRVPRQGAAIRYEFDESLPGRRTPAPASSRLRLGVNIQPPAP